MKSLSFFARGVVACSLACAIPLGSPAAPNPEPTASAVPGSTAPPEIGRVSTSDRHDEAASSAIRPTYVVDRAQIDARGDRTIAQALEQTPGLALYRYGAFGAQVSYGIRGSTSEQTLILVDGQPIAAESSGSIDLGTLSTIGVSRIEIVESGGSTLYGTSAVGGVINIITGIPRGTYLEISGGSYGESNLRVAQGVGGFGVSFERHIARNNYGFPQLNADAPGVRANAEAQQSAGRLTYTGPLGGGWHLRTELGTDATLTGLAGDLDFGATPAVHQDTSRNDVRIELRNTGSRGEVGITYAGSRQRIAYNDPANGGESDSVDGRSQLSLRGVANAGRSTIVGGFDLGRLTLASTSNPATGLTNFDARQSQSAAYLQETFALGGGSLVYAGIRGEHDAPLGSAAAPSVGALVNAGPLRLKANLGETFRVPTFDELYYPGFGNAALVPERARVADVTLEAPRLGGGVTIGWFGRESSNLIQTVAVTGPTSTTYLPENVQRASIRGLIATAKTPVFANGLVGTLGVTDIYRALDLTSVAQRLTYQPVFLTTASLERPIGVRGFGYGLDARFQGSHVESSGGTATYGSTLFDAFARARIAGYGIATVRVRNLFDQHYEPIAGYPAPGRTVEFELSTR